MPPQSAANFGTVLLLQNSDCVFCVFQHSEFPQSSCFHPRNLPQTNGTRVGYLYTFPHEFLRSRLVIKSIFIFICFESSFGADLKEWCGLVRLQKYKSLQPWGVRRRSIYQRKGLDENFPSMKLLVAFTKSFTLIFLNLCRTSKIDFKSLDGCFKYFNGNQGFLRLSRAQKDGCKDHTFNHKGFKSSFQICHTIFKQGAFKPIT